MENDHTYSVFVFFYYAFKGWPIYVERTVTRNHFKLVRISVFFLTLLSLQLNYRISLRSYFWGYFVSQIPGARIAENFSAKYVMLFSVAINVVCTILTPLAANIHYLAMIAMRIGEGIGGGVTFPAMHVMLAAWVSCTTRNANSKLNKNMFLF